MARLTTGLLAVSLGVVAGVATPAVLRAAGVKLHGDEPSPGAAALPLPHQPPELLSHDDPDGIFDPDDDEAPAHGQLGLARGRLVLHEAPATLAPAVGAVQAGAIVTLLRVAGEWALVYARTDAGAPETLGGDGSNLVVGWVKKSEIAVR